MANNDHTGTSVPREDLDMKLALAIFDTGIALNATLAGITRVQRLAVQAAECFKGLEEAVYKVRPTVRGLQVVKGEE